MEVNENIKINVLFSGLIKWLFSQNTMRNRLKKSFIFTIIISLIANGFSYVNFMPQHDAIVYSLHFAGGWEVSLGRFLLPIYGKVKGDVTIPWLTGLLSACFIAILVFFICETFELSVTYEILIIAAALSANASLTQLNSTFQYVAGAYMLAAALAAGGGYLLVKYPSVMSIVLSSVLFTISMGLYQGEIVFALILLSISVLLDAMHNQNIKVQFRKWCIYALSLVLAACFYYVLYRFFLNVYGRAVPDSYNSLAVLRHLTLSGTASSAKINVLSLFSFFYGADNLLGLASRMANIILTIITATLLIRYIYVKKKQNNISVVNTIIIGVCLVIFPVLSTSMTIIMGRELGFLADNGIFMLYPLFVLIFSETKLNIKLEISKILTEVFVLAMSVICFQNVIYSNGAYSIEKIIYDRTISSTTQVIYDLDQLDGYIPGDTEVVIMGTFNNNDYLTDIATPKYSGLSGFWKSSITSTQNMVLFYDLMGFKLNLSNDSEIIEGYSDLDMVRQMPQFPVKGYVSMIDGRAVVKLSEQ